jgi:NAD(P)H dehydrogenase (quinone)
MPSPDLLITGASGHFGQRVLNHLLYTLHVPADRIVAASRKPAALAEWRAKGVTTRAADFDDRASLGAAFAGVERLLLISTDALDYPGHRLAQHLTAIDAASRAGARHVIYISMPKPEGSPLLLAPDHAGTEAALAASPLPEWTVLRNNWYFENLFMSLPSVLGSGKWFTAAGDGKIANIARDDLARAAATALAGATQGKTRRTLTGGKAYTTAEIAALVSQTVDKPIEVIHVPAESLIQGMVAHGMQEPMARLFASFDTNTAAGGVADVTGDFTALTGVDPLPFQKWLAANKQVLSGFGG